MRIWLLKKKYLMKLSNLFNWLGINFWGKKLYHFLSHLKIKVSETIFFLQKHSKQHSWWLFHKLFTFLTKSVTYNFWIDTFEIFNKIKQLNQYKNKHWIHIFGHRRFSNTPRCADKFWYYANLRYSIWLHGLVSYRNHAFKKGLIS